MPYESVSDVPDNVPEANRKQWLEVFNSAYAAAKKDGKSAEEAEQSAFAQANGVAGPNAKKVVRVAIIGDARGWKLNGAFVKAAGTKETGFVRAVEGPFRCGHCQHMEKEAGAAGYCVQEEVNADPELKDEPRNDDNMLLVAGGDCCNEYDSVKSISAEKAKAMGTTFKKFIPFVKIDVAKREVWGIVTAEVPDKDDEVCDYEKSKPFYQALIAEMAKSTSGTTSNGDDRTNFFPLREMHQLKAAGKCIGFEFRDDDKEIYMGFKVVDKDAWTKVDEGVYTGFSQGGNIVGELTPDPLYKNCMRYVADPSEASLVDNPCLGVAHFAYVKSDGAVELRKIRSIAKTEIEDHSAQSDLPAGSSQPQDATKYLVEDGGQKFLPYTDATGKPDRSLMATAWAALTQKAPTVAQYQGPDKDGAIERLTAIFAAQGLDTPSEKARKVFEQLRVPVRKWSNKNATRIDKLPKKQKLAFRELDQNIGKLARKTFAKGMYEVSRLACSIQDLAYMVCAVHYEQLYEEDTESRVAADLADHIGGLLDTFLEYAEEEAGELREELTAHMSATV